MELSNRERVGRGLDLLRVGLAPFVRCQLERLHGANWLRRALDSLSASSRPLSGEANFDVTALATIILDPAHACFARFRQAPAKSWICEVRAARNAYAHQEEISDRYADRALDTMELILDAVASGEAVEVRKLRKWTSTSVLQVADKLTSTVPPVEGSTPVKGSTPLPTGVLAPDVDGYERGVRLLHFLADIANRGAALGIGYAAFIEYLHGKPFESVMSRPYAQSDTGPVIDIAHDVTRRAGRVRVSRGGTSIQAGMDTFIWPLKKPHERSNSAWGHRAGPLPYTKEEWRTVFPDDRRRLVTPEQLRVLVKQ